MWFKIVHRPVLKYNGKIKLRYALKSLYIGFLTLYRHTNDVEENILKLTGHSVGDLMFDLLLKYYRVRGF